MKISDGPEENRVDGCINILSRGEQPPDGMIAYNAAWLDVKTI